MRWTRLVLALVVVAAALATAASTGAKEYTPDCRAHTALAPQPHRLTFRIRCNFELNELGVNPTAQVRKVRRKTTLKHPDPEDRMRCKRAGDDAGCSGRAGEGVTVIGTMRVHGARCSTSTRFDYFGGVDCDGPQACIRIGYAGWTRDHKPTGC